MRLLLAHGGVDHLADGEGDHGCLAGAGLGLRDDVAAGDDGEDGALLDGGGLLEAIAVDAAEEVVLDAHLVEAADDLDPRGGLEGEVFVVHVARAAGAAAGGGWRRHWWETLASETLAEEEGRRRGRGGWTGWGQQRREEKDPVWIATCAWAFSQFIIKRD